jgi:hypothetical protein
VWPFFGLELAFLWLGAGLPVAGSQWWRGLFAAPEKISSSGQMIFSSEQLIF